MTSPKVGLSGSGSCRAHERTWSSNCLISTAPMSGVVMSVFSQLAHLTTNTCHRRSDMADAPGLRRLCADQTQKLVERGAPFFRARDAGVDEIAHVAPAPRPAVVAEIAKLIAARLL